MEDWVRFVCEKGKNRFPNPEQVVEKLKQVARESYRIRPALAESVSLVLVLEWQNIRALEKTLHETDSSISNAFAAFPNTLQSVPGLGPVYSAGLFASIGDINRFASDAQLAKLAGLAWKRNQSGTFEAQETHLMNAAFPPSAVLLD
jgi:transposase